MAVVVVVVVMEVQVLVAMQAEQDQVVVVEGKVAVLVLLVVMERLDLFMFYPQPLPMQECPEGKVVVVGVVLRPQPEQLLVVLVVVALMFLRQVWAMVLEAMEHQEAPPATPNMLAQEATEATAVEQQD
jgi:hypothetical protein